MPDWTPRNTTRARELRNTATPAERLLWQHLSRSQQGAKFSRQMPVGPFFADFLCRELGLVVECDGISHDREPERDQRRDAWLRSLGYTVLRFTNADVLGNVEGVAAAIRLKIEGLRLNRPTPNPPASGRGAMSPNHDRNRQALPAAEWLGVGKEPQRIRYWPRNPRHFPFSRQRDDSSARQTLTPTKRSKPKT